jgi:hypothetical protein
MPAAGSIRRARLFGLVLIALVCGWDMDAMRAHLLARSWYTLAPVGLFLVAHLADYLTVGRLIYRFDPGHFASHAGGSLFLVTAAPAAAADPPAGAPVASLARGPLVAWWDRMVAYEPPLSLRPEPAPARMYAFRASGDAMTQAGGPLHPRSGLAPADDLSA